MTNAEIVIKIHEVCLQYEAYSLSLSLSLRLFESLFPTGKKGSSVGTYVDDFKRDECHPYRHSCNSLLMRRWPRAKRASNVHKL